MWLFKRKEVPLPPIPEFIPPNSAVECCILSSLNQQPDTLHYLIQTKPDTLLVYLYEVGTAATTVTTIEDESVGLHFHTWLAYDQHHKKRRHGAPTYEDGLQSGTTIKITLYTSTTERVTGRVTLFDVDDAFYSFLPLDILWGGKGHWRNFVRREWQWQE